MKIKKTKYGRGVFAATKYDTGDLIEVCPVIVLSKSDTKIINNTLLYDYYFSWGKQNNQAALALGNGSLFNHSYYPNARYVKYFNNNKIHFVSIKPINTGEEILVNYNGDPTSRKPLWFDTDPE